MTQRYDDMDTTKRPIKTSSGVLAIFFDLDNTLIATRQADKKVCNKLAEILWEQYAVPDDFAAIACKSYLRNFRKCPENLSMDLDTWRLQLWVQALGDQYDKYADDIYRTWLDLRYDYLLLAPEIHNLLQHLRHFYFVALITNGPSSSQWEKINRLNLKKYFDCILVSGDLPWEKPHHRIFHVACDYLGVDPLQCIMVGDKLETDILGGIRAELGGTVWIPLTTIDNTDNNKMNSDCVDPNPDYVIECITELLQVLPKNPKILSFRKVGSIVSTSIGGGGSIASASSSSFCYDTEDSNSNSSDGS